MLTVTKNTIMLSFAMPIVILLNVIMLSVGISSVVAPSQAIAIKILGSIYHSMHFNPSLMFYKMLV
jgi:hypothetical protein